MAFFTSPSTSAAVSPASSSAARITRSARLSSLSGWCLEKESARCRRSRPHRAGKGPRFQGSEGSSVRPRERLVCSLARPLGPWDPWTLLPSVQPVQLDAVALDDALALLGRHAVEHLVD